MKFPEDFLIGAASAAYQVEGAWNSDCNYNCILLRDSSWKIFFNMLIISSSGKGENIWDRLVHTRPELVRNKENGDIACNSYHLFKEDVACIKEIGVRSSTVA